MQYEYINRFSYARIDAPLGATALTEPNGQPLRNIVQGNIGIYRDARANVPDKFLYDAFVYDSPKEKGQPPRLRRQIISKFCYRNQGRQHLKGNDTITVTIAR